jgi:diamine N-acetyltransferase
MITDHEKNTVGCVDLFEFDPKNRRAGIGILIAGEHRKKGYASETLEIIIHYAGSILNLKQLYCNISENNKVSINLFKKKGFVRTGTKNDWRLIDNEWENEHFFQLIFES